MDSGLQRLQNTVNPASRVFTLLGPRGPYSSCTPGALGGHRRQRIYGQLDCASALRAIAKGGPYPRYRVFFASEPSAVACGYRPCARCMPEAYAAWKAAEAST
jgi:hypothetical protein